MITTFEYEPAPGVKINKSRRPLRRPGAGPAGHQHPHRRADSGQSGHRHRNPQHQREMVVSQGDRLQPRFEKSKYELTIALGKDIVGNPVVADLRRCPIF